MTILVVHLMIFKNEQTNKNKVSCKSENLFLQKKSLHHNNEKKEISGLKVNIGVDFTSPTGVVLSILKLAATASSSLVAVKITQEVRHLL
jgi:hypothetical protein